MNATEHFTRILIADRRSRLLEAATPRRARGSRLRFVR